MRRRAAANKECTMLKITQKPLFPPISQAKAACTPNSFPSNESQAQWLRRFCAASSNRVLRSRSGSEKQGVSPAIEKKKHVMHKAAITATGFRNKTVANYTQTNAAAPRQSR